MRAQPALDVQRTRRAFDVSGVDISELDSEAEVLVRDRPEVHVETLAEKEREERASVRPRSATSGAPTPRSPQRQRGTQQ